MNPPVKLCRHCACKPGNRSRGLCWSCFSNLAVRDLYPMGSANPETSIFARRGLAVGNIRPKLEATPTSAAPGSARKLAELCARAETGQPLFHPDDAEIKRTKKARISSFSRVYRWVGVAAIGLLLFTFFRAAVAGCVIPSGCFAIGGA